LKIPTPLGNTNSGGDSVGKSYRYNPSYHQYTGGSTGNEEESWGSTTKCCSAEGIRGENLNKRSDGEE
jgi:hypothetical protein